MNTWPTKFPDPLLDTQTIDPGAPVIRSQMTSGYVRQRRRFTNEWRHQNFQLQFDATGHAMFQEWVATKISNGADFFNMQLDLGGGIKTYQVRFIVDQNGAPYKTRKQNPFWVVSGTFEIFTLSLPSASSLSVYLAS